MVTSTELLLLIATEVNRRTLLNGKDNFLCYIFPQCENKLARSQKKKIAFEHDSVQEPVLCWPPSRARKARATPKSRMVDRVVTLQPHDLGSSLWRSVQCPSVAEERKDFVRCRVCPVELQSCHPGSSVENVYMPQGRR